MSLDLAQARCSSKTCPVAATCARSTDLPEAARGFSWFCFDPWASKDKRDKTCPQFIANGVRP